MSSELLCKQCEKCANKQFFDNDFRCARYHDSLCSEVYRFCRGEHFLHIDDGISLYAMKSWINRLSQEELELALLFDSQGDTLIPLDCVRCYNTLYHEHWRFYTKRDDKNE